MLGKGFEMRLGCIGVIVAAGCLWAGGQKVYESFAAGSQQTISLEQLVKEKPSVGWYRITGARWNSTDSFYTQGKATGAVGEELLVLVYPQKGFKQGDKVHLLMRQTNPAAVKAIKEIRVYDTLLRGGETLRAAGNKQITPEEMTKELSYINKIETIAKRFDKQGVIEGTIEFGFDASEDERASVAAAGQDIMASDYMILKPGDKPSATVGFILLAIGIAISLFMLVGIANPKDADD